MDLRFTVTMDLLLFALIFILTFAKIVTKDPLEYFLLEELPSETLIGNIVVDAGLQADFLNDTMASVQFNILRQPNSHDDLFDIDQTSGVIRTTTKIDRDTLCPFQETCHIWLHIAARSGYHFKIIKVMVNVLDTNDHRPVFPKASMDIQIPESAQPGIAIALPAASDLDAANNAIKNYIITSDTSFFDLEVTRNDLDGSTDLKLVLLKPLDREEQERHSLVITAMDGGIPHKTGTLLVNIEVEDSNDNHPVFLEASYEFQVMENAAPGKIGEVSAFDDDHGKNGQVVYRLSAASDLTYGNVLEVRDSNGEIFTKKKLDYEDRSMYVITVEASDLGDNHNTGKCTVVVKVQDINDNTPSINLNTLTDGNGATVLENSPLGTFVAHMSVADLDAGLNGEVECILNHPHFGLDEIYSGQFKVVTSGELDRETVDHYTVPIACLDRGSPPNIAALNLSINVLDVNDNAPKFEKNIYYFSTKENNEMGAIISDVKATDADQDNNAAVRYSLLNDDLSDASKLFNIHPLTGQISTNAIFDHEAIKEIKFKVTASDEGHPMLSATATIILSIIDVNDEPPKFLKESYHFGTFENQPAGTEVGSVVAIDADEVNDITYEVTYCDDSVTEKTFDVDPDSGRISTTVTLDREERQIYFMVVTAKSETYPPMSAAVNVTIHVADTNDNAPSISFPNEFNHTIEISAYEPLGTKITKILATDDDIGTNAKLWYFIEGGDDERFFKIDPISGSVSIQNDISGLAGQTRELSVKVEDSGHPMQRSLAALKVIIHGQTNGLKLTSEIAKSNSSTVIVLCVVSILVILTLIAGVFVMWRKGVFTLNSRSKESNEGQAKPAKPRETQRMLNSFTMISFLRDNEINNEKNTINTGHNRPNNAQRQSLQLNNAVEHHRHLQNTPRDLNDSSDQGSSTELRPVSHIVNLDTPTELQCQEFSSFMSPVDLPETKSGYDEISSTDREAEQESAT